MPGGIFSKKDKKKKVEAKSSNSSADAKTEDLGINAAPADTKKIVKLADKKIELLNKVSKIDDEIIAIQRSTRTNIRFLAPAHNSLRMKFKWYYKWHLNKYASFIHYLILIAYILLLSATFIFASNAGWSLAKLFHPEEAAYAASINISGVCKQYDRTTNCADSEVVKIAVNGVLSGVTTTTATGAWTLTAVTVNANDIITVFVDNVADANEANAVAKVAATPVNITGVALYERHLTLGASSNQTLINLNLSQYDNSVSADEDIFFEVDASMNLTLPATGTQTATDQQLYLLASNPFNPNAAGGKTITVPNLNLPASATLTAGPNTFNLTASGSPFTRAGTFTATSSTFNYLGSSATNVTSTTYVNLGVGTVADTGTGVTYTLAGNITVSGVLTVGNASSTNNDVLAGSSRVVTLSGSGTPFVVTAKGTYTINTSTINYTGTAATNVTGGITYYNLGVGTTANSNVTTYTLTGDTTVTNLITIGQATTNALDTFALSSYNLTVSRATSSPFTVNTYGRFQADTSRVYYTANNAATIAALTYYNLSFTPTITAARVYTAAGAITVNNAFVINPTASSAYSLTFNLAGAFTATGGTLISKVTNASSIVDTTSANNYAFSTGTLDLRTGGTLNLNSSTFTLSGSGDVVISTAGTLNYASASVVYTGASATNVAALNYKNLTINHTGTTFTALGNMEISSVFTITAGTFDASSATITLTGTGTPFVNNGTLTPSTSTFKFTGVGDTTIASTTYYNLETSPSADLTGWIVAGAGDTTYNGTYLQSGTFNGQPAYTYNGKWLYYNYDEYMCMCYNWVLYSSKTNMGDVGMSATYYTSTTLPGTWYENYNLMNGPAPSLTAYSAEPIYTLTAGTLDVAGNYVNGDGTHDVSTKANTNDPIVRVHGNFTNAAAGAYYFSDSANTYLSGNYTNAVGGVVATTSSLIIFDGSGAQTITANGTTSNTDYSNISITNASASGVTFADSITMAGLTATTANTKITVQAGSTITLTNLSINGQADTSRVVWHSSADNSPWYLVSSDTTPTVSNLDVKDSDASGGLAVEALTSNGCLDSGGNTNWYFTAATPISVSGHLYTSDLDGTVGLEGKTLGISVDGGPVSTVDTTTGGVFSFSSIPMRNNAVFVIFIKQETEKGTIILKEGTISGDVTDVVLNAGHVKLNYLAGTEITNAMIEQADASGDSDLMFSAENGVATYADGVSLHARADRTYRPGGNVICDDMIIKDGTFNLENNSLTISGSYQKTASGTFTAGGSSIVTFDSASTGETITSNGTSFNHVTFNNAGGSWSVADAMTLTGDLTVTAGTLYGTNNITVNGGDVSGNGTINMTGGTFVLDGEGNFGGNTDWTFNGLTFGDGTGSATTAKAGSGNITASGILSIATNQTLNADDDTWTLSGSGTPCVINGTFREGTSTFIYTGSSATNVTGTTYYNLTTNHTGVTFTSSGPTEIKNVFTIQAGTFNASNSTIVLSGSGTPFVKTGIFDASTSTIRYTGGGATNVLSTDYYHLETKPAPASSALGNGLAFRGGTSIASAGSNAALNISTNLTLDIWLEIDSPNQNSGLLYKGPGGGSQGDYALEYYANTFDFRLNGNTTIGTGRVVSSAITDNNLHHIAATYDGSKQRVWVDGVLDGEQSYSAALNTNNVGLWLANYYDGNYGFNGKIYAARVSNIVRYTSAFAPSQSWSNDANTALLWNFEDGSGTSINDSSSNNIDGTVSGTYSWVGAPVAGDGSGWVVSGSLNTGYTGNYVVDGTYGGNNKPAYTNGTNWIFNDNAEYAGEMWCMAASKYHLYDSMSCMYYTGATITGTWYPGMEATGTPVLSALEGGYAYTLASGTLNVTGNLVNGDGTNKVALDATTNDPIVNIDGALTISANARFVASNSAAFSVASNYTNNGKLTDSAGTLTFDGQGLQTITAGGTDADHDFKNLTVTNASTSGVSFADSATVTGTFTDVTPSSKLVFNAGSTFAFANININGQASGTRITMKSSTDTQHWHFNVTQTAPSVSYVSVRDSDASGGNEISAVVGSADGTGNTHWTFAGTAITISGTVYTSENKSTNIGASKTVRIVINGDGGSSTTVETGSGGTFSFGNVVLAINNPVLVYLSGETEKASLVTQAATATSDITGLELYTNHIILTHETAGPLTNSIIETAIAATDTDNLMTADASHNITFSVLDNIETWIMGGKTYTPGAEAYFGSLDVLANATFTPENNLFALNSSGTPLAINGTLNVGGSTALYQGASATNITATTYKNLTVSRTDTTFTAAGNITVSGVFTIDAGSFDASDKVITLSGSGTPFVKTGTLTASTSTFKYTGAGATTVTAADYYNLETVPASAPSGGGGWVVGGTLSDSSYTGTYTASGTMNGYAKYTNGSKWLFYNFAAMDSSYEWALASAASDCGDPYMCLGYYQYPGATVPNSGTWYPGMDMTGMPTFTEAASSYVYTFASGTFNVGGNYTNGTESVTVETNATTNDPILNIDGNFSNLAGSTFIASNSAAFSVASSFTNSATGKFTDSGGTLTLDGQGLQTITAGGTTANFDFTNLTITNASAPGVEFADSVTATGTFTDVTASSKITFHSGSTYAFNAININGQATGTRITLTSSSSGTPWNLNITASSPTASYVIVKDSNANKDIDATTGGYDNTGNTHWLFPVTVYVSGTVYTAENESTNIGANKTVALSINGGTKVTDETDASGIFRFDDVNIGANNPITLFLDGETEKASLVTIAADGTSAISSLEMFTNRIVLSHASAGPISNSVLATADNACSSDCLFSLDGSNVATFGNSYEVFIPSGKTYTPGAAVILDDIEADGTLTLGANAATIHGSWDSADGFFSSSGTVTFDAASGTEVLNTGGVGGDGGWIVTNSPGDSSYSGTYAPSGTFNSQTTYTNGSKWLYYNYDEMGMSYYWVMYTSVTNLMDAGMSAGYYDGATLPGTWYENWNLMNGPAPTLSAVTAHGGSFTNLTKSGGGTLQLSGNNIDIDGTLSVSASNTFDINGQNITLATLSNEGTFKLQGAETATITSLDTNSGTIEYSGTSAYDSLLLGSTYNNLKINGSGGSWTLSADLAIAGVLDINDGTLNAATKTITLSGGGTPLIVTGTFLEGASTVVYTGSSATNVAGTTYNDLTVNHAGTTFTAAGNLMVRDVFTITAGTFDASSRTITLNGTGTPMVNNGTFVPSTSTVLYTNNGAANVLACEYNNLSFANGESTYKKSISVSNVTGGTLTNYEVRVNLTSSNFSFLHSTIDGRDIRFKDNDDSTALNYFIESWNYAGETASVWVKVPSISTSGTTIYMYYGDSSLQSQSSEANTFTLYDPFDDLDDWTVTGTDVSVSDGVVNLNSGSAPRIERDFSAGSTFLLEARYQRPTSARNRMYLTTQSSSGSPFEDYGDFGQIYWRGEWTGVTLSANTWYKVQWFATSNNYTWKILDGSGNEVISRSYGSAVANLGRLIFTGTESGDSDLKFDWVRIRKTSATEPVATVGAEGNAVGTWTFAGNTTINNDLTITSGVLKGSTRTIDVKGDWTNAGTFTAETSTATFSGTDAETITAGGSSFNNLSIANASTAGVTFADAATATGTFTDVTPSSKVTFNSGSTYAFNALNINGQAVGTRVMLTSSSAGSAWNLNVTEASPVASNVSVRDSNANKDIDATTGGEDLTGNTHWLFPSNGITISGTVYTAENKSTNIGANKTIALSINGTTATTVETGTGGVFSFTTVTVAADNTITLFIDDETEEGNLVTQATNSSTDITGLEMYSSKVVLRHETAGPISNTLLDTANNCADNDIKFTVTTGNATFEDAFEVWIETGKTYTPGGNVTVGPIDINGTFSPEANTITVRKGWDSIDGSFTEASSLVAFTSVGTTGNTIDVATTETFNAVTFNATSTSYGNTIATGDTIVIGSTLTLTNGYIHGPGAIQAKGNISQANTMDGGTASLSFANDSASQTYTIAGGLAPTLYLDTSDDASDSVVFNGSATFNGINIAAAFGDSNTVPFTYNGNNITIQAASFTNSNFTQASGIFNAPATWTIGTYCTFTKTGGTINASSTSLVWNASNSYTSNDALTFPSMSVSSGASGVIITSGSSLNVTGNLVITAGYLNGPGTVNVGGNVTVQSSASGGSGVINLNGSSDQTYSMAGIPPTGAVSFNKASGNLKFENTSASGRTLTLSSAAHNSGGNLTVSTTAGGGLTLTAATNNPSVTIPGNIAFTKTTTGVPAISMGSNTWTVGGNANFTNGTVTAGTSTLVLNSSAASQTLTSASQSLSGLTIQNTHIDGVIFADSATTSGTFTDITPSSKATFNSGSTYAFNAININGQAEGTRVTLTSSLAGSAWNLNITAASPAASYVSVKDSNANKDIDATTGGEDLTGNTHWLFPVTNTAPTNESLTFTNPYTSNVAIADNTTLWNFSAQVSDADQATNLDYVELHLANSADSSQPYDSLKFRWTESSGAFTEVADTQNAAVIDETSSTTKSGDTATISFKIKFNSNFLANDTNYAAELYSIDDAAVSDTDNYSNLFQVSQLSLNFSVDSGSLEFGSLLPGSVITGSTAVTVTTNFPNGYSLSAHDGATGSNSALLHTDTSTRIADYLSSISLPTLWSGNGLGICVVSATGKDTSKWGTGTTAGDSNNKYAGVPETATIIHSKTGNPTTSNQTVIGYKLVVPNTQKTGNYQGIITYTATGVLN